MNWHYYSYDHRLMLLIVKFQTIAERFQIVEDIARYKEKFGIATIQNNRMIQQRIALKSDFYANKDITDDMIDNIMTI